MANRENRLWALGQEADQIWGFGWRWWRRWRLEVLRDTYSSTVYEWLAEDERHGLWLGQDTKWSLVCVHTWSTFCRQSFLDLYFSNFLYAGILLVVEYFPSVVTEYSSSCAHYATQLLLLDPHVVISCFNSRHLSAFSIILTETFEFFSTWSTNEHC